MRSISKIQLFAIEQLHREWLGSHRVADHWRQRQQGIFSMSSLNLGIYAHWRKSGAAASLKALLRELSSHDMNVLVEEQAAKLIGAAGHPLDELYQRVDLFVALGGDGTLLRLVRDLRGKMKPIMGINFGSFGFLTCFGGPEYAVAAKALAMGDYRVDERTLLEASIERNGETIFSANWSQRCGGHSRRAFAPGAGSIYTSIRPTWRNTTPMD